MSDQDELRRLIQEQQAAVNSQGDEVRKLKGNKADKADIDAAIAKLKELKIALDESMAQFQTKKGDSSNKEAFRAAVSNVLEQRLFYIPSFQIYGGVAGLYDYGPPGSAVKSNIQQFWRQHFVLEEDMLEIECPSVTPEVVLKASGHVDKFSDLMVRDVVNLACFRADHILKAALEPRLDDPLTPPDAIERIKDDLARLDEFDVETMGKKLKEYAIKAPDTGNDITDPFPFNLMFATQIGPTGQLQGFLRPETAQGIFVNFRNLLGYNGGKLPFAAAQIGQSYRNEIAPRAGLLRVREFTQAEIEHFVNPEKKEHPKFDSVKDLEFIFFPKAEQLGPKTTIKRKLGDMVTEGLVNNETLGYFIGRCYLFLTKVGIDPERLRFRQHLDNEMAHYACDCWDAEIECSYGWVECVGIADRSAYDLTVHTKKSKVDLIAYEKFPEPVEVDVVTVKPSKKDIAKAFKKDTKVVTDYLEGLEECDALALKATLDAEGKSKIPTANGEFEIEAAMVSILQERKKLSGRSFTPSVIEPSFGIGRIMYCMFEHCFYVREDDEQKGVFAFKALVAPIKCTVFPLLQDKRFEAYVANVSSAMTALGLANKVDTTGTGIGKRYARTDEIGVPFAVTVDHQTVEDATATLRERDSTAQVRVPVAEIAPLVRQLVDGAVAWEAVAAKYPSVEARSAQ
eukprot:scaffold1146_cov399-Prasinococcus_capsulatus_cf.AAC.67